MKPLRLFCATATLICAFAFSAHAGNIECTGFASPPPDTTTSTSTATTADGEAPCPGLVDLLTIVIESALALP